MSLGASSGRVTRQLLTESLVLGLGGGALGVALAWGASRLLVTGSAGLLPRATNIGLDGTVLGVSLLVTLAATALASILPALRVTDVSPAGELREGGRGVGGSAGGVRLRRGLVAAEVALAVVLLIGAGLLIRSLGALGRVDAGFRTENRVAMTLTISDQKHPERGDWLAMYHQILERLQALPGVEDAGAIRYLPFRGTGEAWPVQVPGLYEPAPEDQLYSQMFQVSPRLFDALGVRLLRGRTVLPTDGSDDPKVAVVNEAFQKDYFQGQDPVGRRFKLRGYDVEVEVVGVVANVHHRGLDEPAHPSIYMNNDQVPRIQMSYVVHTAGNGLALAGEMRRVVREVDPEQTISEILPLGDLTSQALARPRFFTFILVGFAALALVLAALGVYGVLAYVVRSRAREMGLRLALGASAGRVVRQVLAQGMVPVAAGLIVGIFGAAGLSRFLASLLFGVEPLDGVTYVGVALTLGAVALAACLVPALSATRVDPMESLRAE
jgi:predicted permease